jgi:hypothetical protein
VPQSACTVDNIFVIVVVVVASINIACLAGKVDWSRKKLVGQVALTQLSSHSVVRLEMHQTVR